MKSRIYKQINHWVGKAIHDYNMISHDDRILVGVSGGRDSLTLLNILSEFQKKAPVDFKLFPVYVDPGFDELFAHELEKFVSSGFGSIWVEYKDHGVYAHSKANGENPCFLCSKLRRKTLFDLARHEKCNKIALGHNKDDLIETLFLNMFYSGRLGTMNPCQSFFDGRIEIIRPLSYVEKDKVIQMADLINLPEFVNPCPSARNSKRIEIRKLLNSLYKENSQVKGNIFSAMHRVETDYLLKR